MTIPLPYVKGSGAIASYDWLDITAGVGYRTYYGCGDSNTSGYSYFLTPSSSMGGGRTYLNANSTGAAFAKEADIDFDITLGRPAYVEGYAYFYIAHSLIAGAGAAGESYLIVYLYHYDGATETQLATGTTVTRTIAAGTTEHNGECLILDVTAGRKFKVGEILRVNVQVWNKDSANPIQSRIHFDPTSGLSLTEVTSGRSIPTSMNLEVPFRVQI
jgi:hypothetical protein